MTDVPRSQVVLSVLVVAVVAFLGARALRTPTVGDAAGPVPALEQGGRDGTPTGADGSGVTVSSETGGVVVVHVAGAVRHAGVYRLRAGRRVGEAVRRAGGATGAADLDAINLAAKVTDGQQVLVPRRAAATAAAGAPGDGGTADAGASALPGVPLNLNTATLEQLDTLDGVGPATAQKILDERQRRGGFRSVDDLAAVPGIGPKRLAAIRAKVRV